MVHFFHRGSLFPLVLIFLSLALGGLFFWSGQDRSTQQTVQEETTEPIDVEDYQSQLVQIMDVLDGAVASAQEDADKRAAAQTALSQLLALRVPAEYKNLHLSLAVALSQIEQVQEDAGNTIDEALARITDLRQAYSWLAR